MDGEKDFGPKIVNKESYIIVHMNLMNLFLYIYIYIYTCSALGVSKFMMLLHK